MITTSVGKELIEIKDFNVLIDSKPFLDQPTKNKQDAYEKLVKISRNDDCRIGNLLAYLYHQKYHKLIEIVLWRQNNTIIPQKINSIRNLEEDDGAAMFFIAEKQQKTIPSSSLDSLIVGEKK